MNANGPDLDAAALLCRALGLTPWSGGYYWGTEDGELIACIEKEGGYVPWIFSPEGAAAIVAWVKRSRRGAPE